MNATDRPPPPTPAAREVVLARARALARHGRYAEAAGLLDQFPGDEPALLDLRARVHAQQGQLDQADSSWARAQQIAPGTAEYAAGRRRIAAIRARGGRRRFARPACRVGGVLAVALALALLIDLIRRQPRIPATGED